MRLALLAAIFAGVFLAAPAFAQDDSCDRGDDSQQMMNICAAQDYQAADAKLNDLYKRMVGGQASDGKSLQLLKAAERAWIAYRDAECAYATQGSEGGSIQPMLNSQCLTRVTYDRIKQLKSDTNCDGGGDCDANSDGSDDQDEVKFGDQ